MFTVGSLFSGIGGLELGLEMTGGFRTIWQCEIDPYCREVLAKHWPGLPIYGDITQVDWSAVERPDVLCGGFPCQDISVAGKGAGIVEGTRSGLWFEFRRCISVLRPRIVLIENVAALAIRGLDIVLADLAEAGYDAEWADIRAADVGAPHRRERLFIVAYTGGCGFSGSWSCAHALYPKTPEFREANQLVDAFLSDSLPFVCGGHDGVPERLDLVEERLKALGNAVVPQVAEHVGRCILSSI